MLEGLFTQLAAKSPPPIITVPPVPPEKTETKAKSDKQSLLPAHRKKLLDYMAAIDETDPAMIEELLTECAKNPEALAWALGWADKLLAKQKQSEQQSVTCRHCEHFRCFNAHGGGAGACGVGVMPMGACHWSETAHDCDQYQARCETVQPFIEG